MDIARNMSNRDYRKVAERFLALTSPVYLCLYGILVLIRSQHYDDFTDSQLMISFVHVFGLQGLHWLLVRTRTNIDFKYVTNMLWFMVYNNILLFSYWVFILDNTRSFIYLLAPMSVVALFTITTMKQAVLYNFMLSLALAVAAAMSVSSHGYPLSLVGLDWVYITVYFIVSVWISYMAELYHQNRMKLSAVIKSEKESKSELEFALRRLSDAHNQLEQISNTDALTNISNRRYFDELLDRSWASALIAKQPFSVLMVDIDHFKSFNDEYGHQVGDECLQLAATTISNVLSRQADEVCRYGGEEFSVVLPATNCQSSIEVAEKIRQSIEAATFEVNGEKLNVTASIGAATLSKCHMIESAETLVSFADKALYQAKSQGRNRVVHWTKVQDKDSDPSEIKMLDVEKSERKERKKRFSISRRRFKK